jgi:hypothetical protein
VAEWCSGNSVAECADWDWIGADSWIGAESLADSRNKPTAKRRNDCEMHQTSLTKSSWTRLWEITRNLDQQMHNKIQDSHSKHYLNSSQHN